MANITSELTKGKKLDQDKLDQNKAVKAVLLLERHSSMEDLRISNALGSRNSVSRAQTELGKKLDLEKLEGRYAGNVYTISQIKKLAGKYNMRFLASKFYCGNIDVNVISKIKDFNRETGVEITDANLQYNFFILAPEKCFELNVMIKEKKDPDPALFYKIDENHYRLVHQWGNDFNIMNRISGYMHFNRNTKFGVEAIGTLIFIAALFFVIRAFTSISLAATVTLFTGVIGMIRAFVVSFESDITEDDYFHRFKWNSSDKRVH